MTRRGRGREARGLSIVTVPPVDHADVQRLSGAPGPDGDTWIELTSDPLPADVSAWTVLPSCGALVTFCGTVRDHAEGRDGVEQLTYEAYEEVAVERMGAIADEARQRWPELGRIALLHRTGALELRDVAVVVAVSAPHRGEAFDAARWCIDTIKSTVPIWKRERWAGGEAWGADAQPLQAVPTSDRPAVSAAP